MELGVFERQLRLMVLLAQNRAYTLDEISRRLGMGKRTIYRYLELFRDMGFVVERANSHWRIDRSSPFFRDITGRVQFTDEEALILRRILNSVSRTDIQARLLMNKLSNLYDIGFVAESAEADELLARNLSQLYDAMREQRVVILRDYQSASSRTVSDRAVEPFQLLNGGSEVRCFEITTRTCKTFKLTRIGRVEIVDLLWSFASQHKTLRIDAFGFSAEKTRTVEVRMGALAQDLLREEYPMALQYLKDGVLTIPVCSFLGIGRFVMGLPDETEVIGDDEFKAFLNKFKNQPK